MDTSDAKKIIFVCEGNVCRSPTAESVLSFLIKKAGLSSHFSIASRGTIFTTIGQDIDSRAKQELINHSIPIISHKATLITKKEYDEADYVIGMERANLVAIKRIIFVKNPNKLHRLFDFSNSPHDIEDPFFTHDFSKAYSEIELGCQNLLQKILTEAK